ncbi:MAG: hypothetical protein ABEJ00_02105 [Gemmatimonadota bacterium]
MPAELVSWLQSRATLILVGLVGLVALSWAYEAAEEAEEGLEAVQGFGAKAKNGTGGALNLLLVALVSVTGWGVTTFQTAGGAAAFLAGLAPQIPVLTASMITISLGALGLSGMIRIQWWHFTLLSLVIVLLGFAYQADLALGEQEVEYGD